MIRHAALLLIGLAAASPAAALDLTLLHTYDGQVLDGEYGFACAVIGDMDGDGFAEFAIGANADSTGGPSAGRVFVFRGGDSHLGDPPAWVITGLPGDLLGFALAGGGDIDADGRADLLIGAPGNTDVVPGAAGRVLIAYGANPIGSRPLASLPGDGPGDRFGTSVALADLDGDGRSEIIAGAPGYHFDSGAVRVFHGGAAPVTLFTLHARGDGDEFGTAVAGAGRTRGGPYSDFLVGAPYNSDATTWAGRAYLYFGGATPDTLPDREWAGPAPGDLLGTSVAGAGDVNGDGRADMLVGIPGANNGPTLDTGRAQLYLGALPPPLMPAFSVLGTVPYGELGLSVAGIGDVNGDGLADFAIGEPGTPDSFISGDVRVYLGRTPPWGSPDTTFAGEQVDDMFGHTISNGGRIGARTRDLFMVGSFDHMSFGRAYLYGRSAPTTAVRLEPNVAGVRLSAPRPNPAIAFVSLAINLERAARIDLEIVDLAGRRVGRLASGVLPPGRHEFSWPSRRGSRLPAGVYSAVLRAEGVRETRGFVLLGR